MNGVKIYNLNYSFPELLKPIASSLIFVFASQFIPPCCLMEQNLVGNSKNGLKREEDIILMHDFDMNHKRRPLVLMQTVGHVAGAAFYYKKKKKNKRRMEENERIEVRKERIQQNQSKWKGSEINNVGTRRKEEFLITNRFFNQEEECRQERSFIRRKGEDEKGTGKESDLFHRRHVQVYPDNNERKREGDGGNRFNGRCLKEDVMSCGKGKKIESRNDEMGERREKKEENEGDNLMGVSIHPRFGGWFAFRAVLVFPTIQAEGMVQVDPLDVLASEEEKEALITSFVKNWKSAEYRNVVQPVNVYSERQRRYFETKPEHRIPLLMTFFRENLTSREFVLGH